MDKLTDRQAIEYFRRGYKAADGLWFKKTEDKCGFEAALEIDREVWEVMPKIQARMIKSMLAKGGVEVTLLESLEAKLSLEGFKFEVEQAGRGFRIRINDCPWHDLMVKSGRERLSGTVGTAICNVEYSVWASEFGEGTKPTFKAQKCQGSDFCILDFEKLDLTEKQAQKPRS